VPPGQVRQALPGNAGQRRSASVTVPEAVKLSPHFSSAGEIALQLDEDGADGLVLFKGPCSPTSIRRLSRGARHRPVQPG
jgi:dihydroorotate dehydrogenase